MSVCTSPAIASPPTTATATGRNSGSTMPRAASGNSVPSVSTADRKGGPVPGRGPRSVTASSTATSVGSALSATMVTQVRGRRSSLISSTRIMALVASSTTCSSVRRTGSRPVTRTPAATSRALSSAASSAVPRPRRRRAPGPGRRAGRWRRRRRAYAPAPDPVDGADGGHVLLQHQTTAVEHADPGGHLLDLGEQVAGEEDRGAAPVQAEQQLADVADALRVEAVGRLVEHQQGWSPHQRGGQPEPLPHAERVGLRRAAVGGIEPDLLEHLVDAACRSVRRTRAPGGGVEEGEVGAPGQVGVGARPLDQRADPGKHRRGRLRHRLTEQLGLAARWPAPARAASARWWSCPSRWRPRNP